MPGRIWTPDDDAALELAVRAFGCYDLERLAERVKRSEHGVRQRMKAGPKHLREAVRKAAEVHRMAQTEQAAAPAALATGQGASQPEAVSRDKRLEVEIVRLREEGRSWSAIGDTVGLKRDRVRAVYSVAVGAQLGQEVDLYEVLRPIQMPAPPARPCVYSPSTCDVIASDWHWPKSDKRAEAVLLETIKRLRPETVYMNGDLWDFSAFSKYDQEYRKRFSWTPQDEADAGAKFLHLLEDIVQEWDGKVVGLDSNHGDRWQKWLNRVAPALVAMDKGEALLGFDKWWIPEWSRLKMVDDDVVIMPDSADPLVITHGVIVRQNGGASANGMGRKLMSSVAHGHTHRIGLSVIRVPARGSRAETVYRCYELGCMADLMPPYVKKPDWANGFGILIRDEKDQSWQIEPVTIVEGKATIATLGGTISC